MTAAEVRDLNPFRLVTIEEAALLMDMSVRQVKRLIADGTIPAWRPSPQVLRVPYWLIVQQISQENGREVMLSPIAQVSSLKH